MKRKENLEEIEKIMKLVEIIAEFREIYNNKGRMTNKGIREEMEYLYSKYSEYKKIDYKYYDKIFLELRKDILTTISDMRATLYL